jgi:predicted dehydrogenase
MNPGMTTTSALRVNRRAFLSHASRLLTASSLLRSTGSIASKADAPLDCGQIGTAHPHATGKMASMQNLPALCRVIGLAEPDAGRRASLASSKVFGQIPLMDEETLLGIPSVRFVTVETAIEYSTVTALRALKAGKHVHLDKPGGFDHEAFSTMRLEAERLNLTLQMGYMLRYNPAFQLLFKAVKEHWLGEITEVDCSMGKLFDQSGRAQLRNQPGGAMFEIAGHLVDVIVAVLGKPQSVRAFDTPTHPDQFSDNQLAVLKYPKATACIRTNFADPFGGQRRRFNVTGTQGTFEILPLESGRVNLSLTLAHGGYKQGSQSIQLEVPKQRYDAEFVDLTRVVRGEKQIEWNAAHDIAVHETTMRAAGLWKQA